MQIAPIASKWVLGIGYRFTIDSCALPSTFNELVDIGISEDSARSLTIPNAGGSSNISEALSMEYMTKTNGGTNFVPEMEVSYWIESSMCDFLMTSAVTGENIGVSVTRAIRFPFSIEFSLDDAKALLKKKLYGLMVARNAISEEQSFFKSILHIWCYSKAGALNIRDAYNEMINSDYEKQEMTYDNVHVICTVCNSLYIYTNRTGVT